jgi:hypothetical protein
MTRWNDGWAIVLVVTATACLAGCGSTDQSPLGGSPSASYTFLASQGFISGSTTKLAGSGSCFLWFGGNMPPGGTSDAQAVTDVTAWAAAGAQNN